MESHLHQWQGSSEREVILNNALRTSRGSADSLMADSIRSSFLKTGGDASSAPAEELEVVVWPEKEKGSGVQV